MISFLVCGKQFATLGYATWMQHKTLKALFSGAYFMICNQGVTSSNLVGGTSFSFSDDKVVIFAER
ncbi:hypothetical protein DSM25558_5123 [Agrobacterium sp. DSM 25558]|nr:hypothetical protein DSM25558_5123 [Agrobacterium sp. DSM 25558]